MLRPISSKRWSKMVPNIQVESNILTVDEVERIQRQKIASLVGHVLQLTYAAMLDALIHEEKLIAYIQELPVLGFNSGKYDLNATKEFLFPYLIQHQPIKFTVKRNSNHMCLKTDFLKLLGISNYLAPGFSYDQFLKAYECEQTKGYFPYEWIDSLEKLQHPSLPPYEAFYSPRKNANTDLGRRICLLSASVGRKSDVHSQRLPRLVQQFRCGAVFRSNGKNKHVLERTKD